MKRIWIILLLLISGFSVSAQEVVQGTVSDFNGSYPIVGATVEIKSANQATVTSSDGGFEIEGLEPGTYTLDLRSVGYKEQSIEISVPQVQPILIELVEKIFDLPSVDIQSVSMTGGLAGVKKSKGSAHFIGQKEIQKFSYTDINRTLRNIPGVNIQEEDGYGLRPNIGLRATGSERSSKVTIMEDGILAAPAPYAAPSAYYFPTIGRVEAIEILKGSSQIKYGPFTTGGAINLISTPIPTSFSGHADFIAGSDNYKMLHANLGNAHKNVAYLVETLQYSADGFKRIDGGGNTGFDKKDYMAKVKVHSDADADIYQSLTFKIGQATEVSDETYLGLTEEDFREDPTRRYAGSQLDQMVTDHLQISLSHYLQLSDNIDVLTRVYRNEFSRNWYKLDKINGQGISAVLDDPQQYQEEYAIVTGQTNAEDALDIKANNRAYEAQGIQTNFLWHATSGSIKHKIDFSVRYHEDEMDRFQWVDGYSINNNVMSLASAGAPGTESNRIQQARAWALYGQYTLDVDRWSITGGLRHENITMSRDDFGRDDSERSGINLVHRSNNVDVWIPGISASYDFNTSIDLFGGIHRGFAPGGDREGAQPELSWNYELGLRVEQQNWSTQVLVYHNDYSNLLGSDLAATGGTGSQDLFNGGSAIAQGIELQGSAMMFRTRRMAIPLTLSYTLSDAFFTSDFDSEFDAWGAITSGDLLPYVPRHQFSLGVGVEHAKYLLDISTRYSSEMLTHAGQFGGASSTTDEAFTVDVALNYRLSDKITAFANVNNVFDNIYIVSRRPAGVRPNLPRTMNVGLKANF